MDRYGQIGPEKGDYASDMRLAAHRLQQGRTVVVALTHRLTRMSVVLSLRENVSSVIAMPGKDDEPWVHVAVDEHGAYWFRVDGYLAPNYVADKLGLATPDAVTVAECLTRLGHCLAVREVA